MDEELGHVHTHEPICLTHRTRFLVPLDPWLKVPEFGNNAARDRPTFYALPTYGLKVHWYSLHRAS